jgi:hypothetical protein
MSELPEQHGIEELSPEDVFSLLGNETRIGIIQALCQFDDDQVSFSDLRDHVAVADSGQFNYHLGKLVGTFVQREERGYELTHAGLRVIGAILDGTYTKRAEIDPFDIGVSCFVCGSSLEASYDNDQFVVRCPNCEETNLRFAFPPGVLKGRTRDELVETANHWIRAQLSFTVHGICPNCAGDIMHSITTEHEHRNHEVGLASTVTPTYIVALLKRAKLSASGTSIRKICARTCDRNYISVNNASISSAVLKTWTDALTAPSGTGSART